MLTKLKLNSWVTGQIAIGRTRFLYYYVWNRNDDDKVRLFASTGRMCNFKYDITKLYDISEYYTALLSTYGDNLRHVWIKSYTSPDDVVLERKSTITVLGDIDLPLDIILEHEIKEFVEKKRRVLKEV